MKALLAAGLMMTAAPALAQDFATHKNQRPAPVVPEPHDLRKPSVEGIVKEIFTVKKPWQLVNPAAPKEYGDGRKNVTYSERDPGKPKGFILLALEW